VNEGRPGTADYKSPGKEKSLRVSISHSRTKRTLHTPHHPKGFVRTDLGVQAQPAQMCVKIAADSFSDVAIPHSAANPKSFT